MRGWLLMAMGCGGCVQAAAPLRATVAAQASTPTSEAAMERALVPPAPRWMIERTRECPIGGPPADMSFVGEGPDCPDDRPFTWVRADAGVAAAEPRGGDDARPEMPSRSDAASALRAVGPEVRVCGGERSGTLTMLGVFDSRGEVIRAAARAPGLTEAIANCALAAMARARVPPFRRERFGVEFVFAFGPRR